MKEYFKNMKIGRKLTAAFSLIIVLYCVTVIVAVASLRDIAGKMEKLYTEPFANVQTSQELIANLQSVGKYLVLIVTSDDPVEEEGYYEEVLSLVEAEKEGLRRLAEGYVSGPEKVAELQVEFGKLEAPRNEVLSLWQAQKSGEALKSYVSDYVEQSNKVRSILADVVALSRKDAEGSLARAQEINSGIIWAVAVASAVIVTSSAILCVTLTKSVVRPISQVRRAAEMCIRDRLKEDHLVQNVRGKGNYICAPSRHTGTLGALKMRHPVYSCCVQAPESVELEFRIEPSTEAITQALGQKPAAVVIADRYYRQGEGAVAYSLSFIPIEVIGEKQVDLSRPAELEAFLETALYEGEYGSTCAFSYTTTGNFTAVKYTLSPESAFILIQETVYDGGRRIVVSSKHYIPVELFEMHLAAGLGEKGKEAL